MSRTTARFALPIACLLASCGPGFCGKIVYPWNATTAIVKAGEGVEVWFDADAGQTVTSAELRGPYHSVALPSVTTATGSWKYDATSGNTYDTRLTVTVPEGTPEDRYDLVLHTSIGEETSLRAVNVVRAYPGDYSIFHISDTHMCQGERINGHPERLFKISALVDIANIIGPELVFLTGDLINNNMFPPRQRAEFFYEGSEAHGLNGVHGFDAATFSAVGNHDFLEGEQPGSGSYPAKAETWNECHGLQAHRFRYGNTRCMVVNTGWNGFDWGYQLSAHSAWLKQAGAGTLRIAAYHKSEMGIMGAWANDVDLGLAMIGHNHHLAGDNPYELGGTPIQYYANSVREYVNFNLYRVGSDGRYSVLNNVAAVENPDDPPAKWRPRLTLTYAQANDGSSRSNTAKLVNSFDVGFPRARVRFVMPKGPSYAVSRGVAKQAFDGDSVRVVDVRVPIDANTTTSIQVEPSTPAK